MVWELPPGLGIIIGPHGGKGCGIGMNGSRLNGGSVGFEESFAKLSLSVPVKATLSAEQSISEPVPSSNTVPESLPIPESSEVAELPIGVCVVGDAIPLATSEVDASGGLALVDVSLPEVETSTTVALSNTRHSSNSVEIVCFCRARLLERVGAGCVG